MSVGYPALGLFQLLFFIKMNPKIWCGISILEWKESIKTGRTANVLLMLQTSGIFAYFC
jgi:hypothetical protein